MAEGAGDGSRSWAGSVSSSGGGGLPPAGQARLARGRSVRSSLLPVGDAVGVEAVWLQPVGAVMGVVVERVGLAGLGCPAYGPGGAARVRGAAVSGPRVDSSGPNRYSQALYRGYDTALERLVGQARALGAHGVVGVGFEVTGLEEDNREFVALGTAVRVDVPTRASRPFTTLLTGQDTATLLLSRWVPVAVTVALGVGIGHDDWAPPSQLTGSGPTAEVAGYTDLVGSTRVEARRRLEGRGRAAGAEGILIERLSTQVHRLEPGPDHVDNVAECHLLGSSIARVEGPHPRAVDPLGILPVAPHGQLR